MIRSVFLGLRTRRIGTRGNSKYHYYGIRVKPSSVLNGYDDSSPPPRPQAVKKKLCKDQSQPDQSVQVAVCVQSCSKTVFQKLFTTNTAGELQPGPERPGPVPGLC